MLSFEELADAPPTSLLGLLRAGDYATIQKMAPPSTGEGKVGDMLEQVAVVCGVYGQSPAFWLDETPAWSFFTAAAHLQTVRNERLANAMEAALLANPQVKQQTRSEVHRKRFAPVVSTENREDALRVGLITGTQNPLLLEAAGITVVTDG